MSTLAPPPSLSDRRRWAAFSICLLAGFMALLDVSIVAVALPSIRTGLHASAGDVQWVSSGYALAIGLVLVASGRLGDLRGRRAVFIAGLTLFTLASAACGLAPTPGLLVAARLVQGLGGGMVQPQVSGFIQELFQGADRARAFGMFGAMVGISTAVGPITGGALIALFGPEHGWRAVFFVNVPVGVVAVLLAHRLLPAPRRAAPDGARRTGLDPLGAVLLGLAVFLLLLPMVEARATGNARLWLAVVPAVALLAAFVGWERSLTRRGGHPMVDLALLKQPSYALGAALGAVYFSGFSAIFFVTALFLQEGHGYDALHSGLSITPFALGSGVSAFVGGRLVSRLGRRLTVIGLITVIAGLVATDLVVRFVDGAAVGPALAAPLLLAGVGSGLVISPNLTLTLAEVPVAEAGTAGGMVQTGQRIGTAAGIAAVGSVLFWRLGVTDDWGSALSAALLVTVALVTAALVLALADLLTHRPAGTTS